MIWFIDIDGCLCDNKQSFEKRCLSWLDNRNILHGEPKADAYNFGERFDVEDSLAEACYESGEFAGYFIEPPAEGAIEFIQLVRSAGDTVVILTSRDKDRRIPVTEELVNFLGSDYETRSTISLEVLTTTWLIKNDIAVDNILFRKNKAAVVKEFGSSGSVAIDDDPFILEAYANNGLTAIAMTAEYNKGRDWNYVDNWMELTCKYITDDLID